MDKCVRHVSTIIYQSICTVLDIPCATHPCVISNLCFSPAINLSHIDALEKKGVREIQETQFLAWLTNFPQLGEWDLQRKRGSPHIFLRSWSENISTILGEPLIFRLQGGPSRRMEGTENGGSFPTCYMTASGKLIIYGLYSHLY
jgi:hypothetical protein